MTPQNDPQATDPADVSAMRLRVIVPEQILLDTAITRLVAEAGNGSFGLLPRHVDFVTALVPGVIEYGMLDGEVRFLGSDEGILVKSGRDVLVSVRGCSMGASLEELRPLVQERFVHLDARERAARTALARLEAEVARRFVKLRLQHEQL
jgi:F-type H+-transporting ATPase subunit epsilon